MRIVDLAGFLALPAGAVFAKYAPCYMEALMIKGESLPRDFLYQDIADAVRSEADKDFSEACLMMEAGESIPMDFNCQGRDGCFEDDQLFAVFERSDVEALIARLEQALKDGYAVKEHQ